MCSVFLWTAFVPAVSYVIVSERLFTSSILLEKGYLFIHCRWDSVTAAEVLSSSPSAEKDFQMSEQGWQGLWCCARPPSALWRINHQAAIHPFPHATFRCCSHPTSILPFISTSIITIYLSIRLCERFTAAQRMKRVGGGLCGWGACWAFEGTRSNLF